MAYFCPKILISPDKRTAEAQTDWQEKGRHKGKESLRAQRDLAYREKGKEESIIAAGPLRVAAVIAGI